MDSFHVRTKACQATPGIRWQAHGFKAGFEEMPDTADDPELPVGIGQRRSSKPRVRSLGTTLNDLLLGGGPECPTLAQPRRAPHQLHEETREPGRAGFIRLRRARRGLRR